LDVIKHVLIIDYIPPLFPKCRMKRFNLLWRSSCDGFNTQEFRRRCDGHALTLMLLLDPDWSLLSIFRQVE
jgi:hypothetical protein